MSSRDFHLAYRLLQDEHKYEDGTLPRKAVHKLLYLVDEGAKRAGIEVSIPYFWYQFGVVTPAEGAELPNETDNHPDERLESDLRPIVRGVLREYYETSLEAVTDATYDDAPYEVQRAWRTLDKKLCTGHPEKTDFFEVEPSRDEIQESIYAVYDAFPTARFPELESDLTNWYSMMTRELNRPKYSFQQLMTINGLFWHIFALHLAEEHRHGVAKDEVRGLLEIDSFEAARNEARAALRQLESEILAAKFADDEEFDTVETRAADALGDAIVSKHLPTHSD